MIREEFLKEQLKLILDELDREKTLQFMFDAYMHNKPFRKTKYLCPFNGLPCHRCRKVLNFRTSCVDITGKNLQQKVRKILVKEGYIGRDPETV